MGNAVAAIPVIGAIAQMPGRIAAGNAEQGAYGYREFQAFHNSDLLNNAAGDAASRGAADAQRPLLQAGQAVGKEQVAAGASGISTGSAAVQGVEASSEAMGRMDSNTVLNNAYREAWGYRQQAKNQLDQEVQLEKDASAAGWSTFLGGGASFFGAVGQGAAMSKFSGSSSSAASGGGSGGLKPVSSYEPGS